MAKVKRKKYKLKEWPKQDVSVKIGNFELYFKNYYNLISLLNDLATGFLYLSGSILNLLGKYLLFGNILTFLGAFSLFLRPVIRIVQNVFIYKNRDNSLKFKKVNSNQNDNKADPNN